MPNNNNNINWSHQSADGENTFEKIENDIKNISFFEPKDGFKTIRFLPPPNAAYISPFTPISKDEAEEILMQTKNALSGNKFKDEMTARFIRRQTMSPAEKIMDKAILNSVYNPFSAINSKFIPYDVKEMKMIQNEGSENLREMTDVFEKINQHIINNSGIPKERFGFDDNVDDTEKFELYWKIVRIEMKLSRKQFIRNFKINSRRKKCKPKGHRLFTLAVWNNCIKFTRHLNRSFRRRHKGFVVGKRYFDGFREIKITKVKPRYAKYYYVNGGDEVLIFGIGSQYERQLKAIL